MKTESGALQGRRILVAVSGSIAAVKTPPLVSALVKAGAQVRCVVTPSAAQLVSAVALASLSRHRCYQDDDQWDPREPRPLHVALAEWAELVIVAPLSASTLARWTQGLGDGLLASLLLACECPVVAAAAGPISRAFSSKRSSPCSINRLLTWRPRSSQQADPKGGGPERACP